MTPRGRALSLIESLLCSLTLIVLILYSYARFFQVPYIGFYFIPPKGNIAEIYVNPSSSLRVGDQLLQIGSNSFSSFNDDLRKAPLLNYHTGDVVPLQVQRGSQVVNVAWEIPGPTSTEIKSRMQMIWLPYLFWLVSIVTLYVLRPRDTRRFLLITLDCLLALWIMAGLVSVSRVGYSSLTMRAVTWLILPVAWHLHWVFPRSLKPLPTWVLAGLYSLGGLLAVAEWFQVLPSFAYMFGFLMAFLGSVILLAVHAIAHPEQRRDLAPLALGGAIVILPTVVVVIAGLLTRFTQSSSIGVTLLPTIPLAYLYAAQRQRLGGLELRTNRAITLLAFAILLLTVSTLAMAAANAWLTAPGAAVSIGVGGTLLAGLASILIYPRFQRWLEHRLLGMPLPPTHLLETYAERITTSQDMPSLVHLLKDEVLPSLLVRQSALLQVDENCRTVTVYTIGVRDGDLPQDCDDPRLLARANQFHPPDTASQDGQFLAWVRLALPLYRSGKQIGLWLLGRRDPDDYYAQSEISILKALANQTAVALINVVQTGQLHNLYQADIEREETERGYLARELHDDVLGQMAMLRMNAGEGSSSPQFEQAYQTAVEHIREIINGLRPAMLSYGLRAAIDELADEIPGFAGSEIPIRVDLSPSEARYPPPIELHLYRIVQQACQNALKHSQASEICITGRLDPKQVVLTVQDNGIGFAVGEFLNLVGLLTSGHFGLAGMYERAALIGASIQIDSTHQHGTKMSVSWTS